VNIELGVDAKNDDGMILDFSTIKTYIDDNYDHRILNECPFDENTLASIENVIGINLDETPFKWGSFENPTAENIAEKIADDILELLPVELRPNTDASSNEYIQVEVFESPRSSVVVRR
jgi:6-pyruvoyl-tetrahydropterin synthase